jgi:PIN domain nuclease of toxin-antitoxin system
MRLLLDTQALLWWLTGDARLSDPAGDAIQDSSHEVFVSAASAWEVTTKARFGKLTADPLVHDFSREITRQGFLGLDISVEHAQRAGNLPGTHEDPFDRMLIAQAQAEDLVLVSNEKIFDHHGVCRLWA